MAQNTVFWAVLRAGHSLGFLLFSWYFVGCGASAPTRDSPHHEPRPPSEETPRSLRELPRDAHFADLATAARTLDQRRDQESDAGCLLRVSESTLGLVADLAVAVRPLPTPPRDLETYLARTLGPVRVLTRFGAYGAGDAELALVAINTTLPPSQGVALSLFLTGGGLYARRSDAPFGERDASRIDWVLERIDWSDFDLVAVTASASTPVRVLAELLSHLPSSMAGRIALAVALEPGTRLPEAPTMVDAEQGVALCLDGLPELDETAPIGDVPPSQIRRALGPLERAAELCVGTSLGRGAAGGLVSIAVRISPSGRVSDACIMEDATGDPSLRACVVRAARALVFEPPGFFVDFALPMRLLAGRSQHQAPICR